MTMYEIEYRPDVYQNPPKREYVEAENAREAIAAAIPGGIQQYLDSNPPWEWQDGSDENRLPTSFRNPLDKTDYYMATKVYPTKLHGAPYGEGGEEGPVVYNPGEDARDVAEATLHDGQRLDVYDGDDVIDRYVCTQDFGCTQVNV